MEPIEQPVLSQEIEWHKIIAPVLVLDEQCPRKSPHKGHLDLPTSHHHALTTLHSALPHAHTIYICVPSASQARSREQAHGHDETPPRYEVLYDDALQGVGRAAALLAAHARSPSTTFLFIGTEYALLPAAGVQQLVLEYVAPLTCFVDAEGGSVPLVAIWGPEALAMLKRDVEEGKGGALDGVVEMVAAKRIRPLRDEWIGVNTPEEWRDMGGRDR